MNIQYCHVRKYIPGFNLLTFTYESTLSARGGQTIAMEELEPWFIERLQQGDFFTKKVGKARCSDKENFNKKIGRELAVARMKPMIFTVMSNKDFGHTRLLILGDEKGHLYELQKRDNQVKVHFLGYE